MILKIQGLESQLKIDDDRIYVLQVENKKLFYSLSQSVYNACEGLESCEVFVIADGLKPLSIADNCMFLCDLLSSAFSSKTISQKLTAYITKILPSEQQLYNEITHTVAKLQALLGKYIDNFDLNVEFSKDITLGDIIKISSPVVVLPSSDLLVRLQRTLDIISMLNLCSVLILSHIKEYLADDELQLLYDYALHKNIKLLLLESRNNTPLSGESVWRVEEDLYDYIEKY